jgi:tryptophanyl-tRNA synthetase
MAHASPSVSPGADPVRQRREPVLYPPRILSGIQPAPGAHLGHYFGTLRQQVELHHRYPGQTFVLIADYHVLTRHPDPTQVRQNTIELATTYLAIGLDPNKATLFRQSDVPECTELAWLLSCVTPTAAMRRVPTYKAAIERDSGPSQNGRAAKKPAGKGNAFPTDSIGLLASPVLMAADIFALRATLIPAGKDQVPHVEMARYIARRFNRAFNTDYLPLPKICLTDGHSVVGLDGRKMSARYRNVIFLFERFDQLKAKVSQIVTDPTPRHAPKDPDACHVMALYSLVASQAQVDAMRRRYVEGDVDYADAKRELTLAIQEYFAPFLDKYSELKRRPDFVADVLREGFREAREQARETLDDVRRIVGLAAD